MYLKRDSNNKKKLTMMKKTENFSQNFLPKIIFSIFKNNLFNAQI